MENSRWLGIFARKDAIKRRFSGKKKWWETMIELYILFGQSLDEIWK